MTKILVPPGIGDIYWVTVKLRSFLEKNGLSNPELTAVSYYDKLEAHLRGVEFLKLFPWIEIGEPQCVENDKSLQSIWDEAYNGPGRSIFPGVMGYDYFIAYNGVINSGKFLENTDEYECDWSVPLVADYGPETSVRKALLCFFPFMGTYVSHESDFEISRIAECINKITDEHDLIPVFMGSKTEQKLDDKRHQLLDLINAPVDFVGRTSLKSALSYVKGCRAVFGYHSGIPNLAAAMGKPTLLLWDNRYPTSTKWACVPPTVRGTTYLAMDTATVTVDEIVWAMENLCQK